MEQRRGTESTIQSATDGIDQPQAGRATFGEGPSGLPFLLGRSLRFVLVEHIRKNRTMTVAQLAATLATHGYDLPGRASKVISDALRWEVARGRIIRTARGVYSYGTAPPSTARRIRLFANHCNAWVVAKTRNLPTPATPPTPVHRLDDQRWFPEDPLRTPWITPRWLWTL